MPLENVTIRRVCLHEVHCRQEEGPLIRPTYGTGLLDLGPKAMSALRSRVIAAFKSNAQCMEMSIRKFDGGSALANGVELIGKRDPGFVTFSRTFADKLTEAQTSRQIPGGLMVVFDGTLGNPATPFFGLMKAELHEGFLKTADLQAQYVDDLFLSPKTKLYKIGLFVNDGVKPRPDLPDGWTATVYDSAMTAANRDAAATYFYSNFLGLDIPVNAAQNVKKFFDETKNFIKGSDLKESEKVDLYNSLYSYLKLDRGNTIQTSKFASTYMGEDLADDYIKHMRRQKFPSSAIAKDLSEVAGSLRLRKLRFPRSITLSGPPDAISELVDVETVNGDDGVQTRITIRGSIQSQE